MDILGSYTFFFFNIPSLSYNLFQRILKKLVYKNIIALSCIYWREVRNNNSNICCYSELKYYVEEVDKLRGVDNWRIYSQIVNVVVNCHNRVLFIEILNLKKYSTKKYC